MKSSPSPVSCAAAPWPRPSPVRSRRHGLKYSPFCCFWRLQFCSATPSSHAILTVYSGTCKEVLGTCVSVGCNVDKKNPRQVHNEINEGQRMHCFQHSHAAQRFQLYIIGSPHCSMRSSPYRIPALHLSDSCSFRQDRSSGEVISAIA